MSRIITNTNIIVDDFNFCKSFPKHTFIHFLTHFHADHYEGLSPLWDYGHIYCSQLTHNFIVNKYPKIRNIHACEYYKKYSIELKPKSQLFVEFYLFDAKHIAGSAMLLFQGFMGSILFTGDFRYTFAMVQENPILFPPDKHNGLAKKQLIEGMSGISLHVDEMIFDNTYCNEHFKFGVREDIVKMMISIIDKNLDKKLVYIAMGALGKHDILIQIAKHFQTCIVVSPRQLEKIRIAGLSTELLTTDPSQGFIQLISKKNRQQIITQTKESPEIGNSFICIDTDFLMLEHQAPDKINYIVPYSLHSNYSEMETLIRMVSPCILRKLVIPYANLRHVKLRIKVDHRLKFAKYLQLLQTKIHRSESGYAYLIRNYTQIYKLSQSFLSCMEPCKSNALRALLQVGDQDHSLRKRPISLPEEDEASYRSSQSKKPSLKSIADGLNAANKNMSIQDSLLMSSQPDYSQQFHTVFSAQSSHSHQAHSQPCLNRKQGAQLQDPDEEERFQVEDQTMIEFDAL